MELITYKNHELTDDVHAHLTNDVSTRVGITAGVRDDCKLTITGNDISIGTGEINIKGRIIVMNEVKTFRIPLATSGLSYGYFGIKLDLSDGSVLLFHKNDSNFYPTLQKDDITNISNGVYEYPLFQYVVNTQGFVEKYDLRAPSRTGYYDLNVYPKKRIENLTPSYTGRLFIELLDEYIPETDSLIIFGKFKGNTNQSCFLEFFDSSRVYIGSGIKNGNTEYGAGVIGAGSEVKNYNLADANASNQLLVNNGNIRNGSDSDVGAVTTIKVFSYDPTDEGGLKNTIVWDSVCGYSQLSSKGSTLTNHNLKTLKYVSIFNTYIVGTPWLRVTHLREKTLKKSNFIDGAVMTENE